MRRGTVLVFVWLLAWLAVLGAGMLHAQAPVAEMKRRTVQVNVHLSLGLESEDGHGSGFVVSPQHVVTNWHVCCMESDLAPQLGIKTELKVVVDKGEQIPAQVLWRSPQHDLAVLKVDKPVGRPTVRFAAGAKIEEGERVWAVGYPGASPEGADEASRGNATLTEGIVSRIYRGPTFQGFEPVGMIQTTAAVNPGNSGGPLFDECGDVVGINHAKPQARVLSSEGKKIRVPQADGINFTIRADELLPALKELGVPYEVASTACEVQSSVASSASWGSMTMQAATLAIALAAVVLAWNRRVRHTVSQRVGDISRSVSQRLSAGAQPVALPPRGAVERPRIPPNPPRTPSGSALEGLAGEYRGSIIPLDGTPCILGRDPGVANLVFPESYSRISKRHCQLRLDPGSGRLHLEDSWSANGTFLGNGTRLPSGQAVELRIGDRFYLADPSQMFRIAPAGVRRGGAPT